MNVQVIKVPYIILIIGISIKCIVLHFRLNSPCLSSHMKLQTKLEHFSDSKKLGCGQIIFCNFLNPNVVIGAKGGFLSAIFRLCQ